MRLLVRPFSAVVGEWLHGPALRHWADVKTALRTVASHTGVPVVLIAAVALVLSYRFAKRLTRFAAELAVVVTLLLVATRLGWISW
ncbi:MAG: hypothetical protein U0169_07330 [Polyangiaceae bacterium]